MMSLNALPSKYISKSFFLFFIVLSLSVGCTTTQPVPVDAKSIAAWEQRRGDLAQIKYWRLRGRLLVSHGEDVWSLSLEWQQKDEDYKIFIHGLFGAGKVKLVGNADGVMLRNSDDQSFYADNPEDLLYQQTGIHMPVEGLRYWVMGLTSPGQLKKPQIDGLGRLAYLEDTNWKVNFKRYTKVSGMDLPRKVFIEKPEQEIDVRLVVDKWTLGAF
ncbi:hypothetical protein MNBD_GAMMA21-186 [hydrothermal vent metagenome]|uniref:Outer-membrane lipoprotein LolB n=1 Tax=hydrothermal vent metagenome TaxID=652676 RepID=A0A3B0ZXF6_9ZZZZ